MKRVEITIGGMRCDACVAKLREALAGTDGLTGAQVVVGRAVVTFDPTRCTARHALDVVRQSGFSVVAFRAV